MHTHTHQAKDSIPDVPGLGDMYQWLSSEANSFSGFFQKQPGAPAAAGTTADGADPDGEIAYKSQIQRGNARMS
jgi:hypothetical protein